MYHRVASEFLCVSVRYGVEGFPYQSVQRADDSVRRVKFDEARIDVRGKKEEGWRGWQEGRKEGNWRKRDELSVWEIYRSLGDAVQCTAPIKLLTVYTEIGGGGANNLQLSYKRNRMARRVEEFEMVVSRSFQMRSTREGHCRSIDRLYRLNWNFKRRIYRGHWGGDVSAGWGLPTGELQRGFFWER